MFVYILPEKKLVFLAVGNCIPFLVMLTTSTFCKYTQLETTYTKMHNTQIFQAHFVIEKKLQRSTPSQPTPRHWKR